MLVVVDANTVFSALLSKGRTFDVFLANNIFERFEFIAPEFLLIEERLAELKLEKSKAFRKLLLSVFNRMSENSKLSDEDCLRLGREVNEKLARRYGLVK